MASVRTIDRVLSLMKERGMTQAELARSLGVLPAALTNWKRRGMPDSYLARAAEVLSTTIDALAGRQYESPKDSMPVILSGRIPVKGRAQLGDDGFYCSMEYSEENGDGFINVPSKDPNAYAVKCLGRSMSPRIQPGEYVIAEPGREPLPGDEVIVQLSDERVMVKRFMYQRDGEFCFGSINSEFPNITVDASEIQSIHPILAIVSKLLWVPD